MIKILKSFYRKQMFFPGLASLFLNPFYFARKGLCCAITQMSHEITGNIVDVGCGTMPYKELFKVDFYRGLDIDTPATRRRAVADDFYDGGKFPYADQNFDSAICNQVLEHVFNPFEFIGEMNRVLKIGGKLLLTVPFVWDEHEQPYDYARYSTFGLHSLLEKNGFKILKHKKLGADATVLFQLSNAYLFKVTQTWPRFAQYVILLTLMFIINLLGVLAGKILPVNNDLFLDHIVLAEKVS